MLKLDGPVDYILQGSKRKSRKDGKHRKTSDFNSYTSDPQEAHSLYSSSSHKKHHKLKQRAQGQKRDRSGSKSPTPDSSSQRSHSRSSSSSNRESESTKMTQFDLSDILGKNYKSKDIFI